VTYRAGLTVAVLALAGAAAVPARAAPLIDQMVVMRDGGAKLQTVRSGKTTVRVKRRTCRVPGSTPLAGLVRARLPKISMRDFSGSCDPSTLFVESIGPDRNRGQSGWVYKVGNRQGTTAASDPSGPFGSGRIKRRVRVTWFYCVFEMGGCQRTLGVRVLSNVPGSVSVRVSGYDDEGRGEPVRGASVSAGKQVAVTDARGRAVFELSPGKYRLRATKRGSIRSFDEKLTVR
jgi:hypothetical protein